jgi:hypothetical protein
MMMAGKNRPIQRYRVFYQLWSRPDRGLRSLLREEMKKEVDNSSLPAKNFS